MLVDELIQIIKDHYDSQKFKDWRKELLDLSNQFEANRTKHKFGKLLAKSYYNFLTQESLLTYESPYPNPLMYFIAELLNFSYISPGTNEDKKSTIINKIRTWINGRNEVAPFSLSDAEIPNLEFLHKHFDSQFIALGDPKDYEDTISSAQFICTRFDIPEDILPDIMHLAACIRAANRIIGYQFTNTSSENIQVPEFQSLVSLIKRIRAGKKISSLKFTIGAENETFEFDQRLSLYLLEEAIRHYYENNSVEFESNIIHTAIKMEPEYGFSILNQDRFNLPYERFFVRLIHPLLKFLKEYSIADDIRSRESCFQIIVILYKRNGVFYHLDEDFLMNKIENWFYLNPES